MEGLEVLYPKLDPLYLRFPTAFIAIVPDALSSLLTLHVGSSVPEAIALPTGPC